MINRILIAALFVVLSFPTIANATYSIVALDAETGARVAGFGEGGRIDLTAGYERPIEGFRWRGPPCYA